MKSAVLIRIKATETSPTNWALVSIEDGIPTSKAVITGWKKQVLSFAKKHKFNVIDCGHYVSGHHLNIEEIQSLIK